MLKKHSVTKNCSDLSDFKSFSRSLEQFFLTVGQNNFGNKIPFLKLCPIFVSSWLVLTIKIYVPPTYQRKSIHIEQVVMFLVPLQIFHPFVEPKYLSLFFLCTWKSRYRKGKCKVHCYQVNDCSRKILVIKGGAYFLRHGQPYSNKIFF
jgi:hypothetical protein